MRTARLLAALEAEAAAVPDPWAMAADVARAQLAARSTADPVAGVLSPAAWLVAMCLNREGGKANEFRLRARFEIALSGSGWDFVSALDELLEAGFLHESWAVDEVGFPPELVVEFRTDVDLPGTA